jgi:hypothetical protein
VAAVIRIKAGGATMAKATRKRRASVKVQGTLPKLTLSMPLDAKKINAIKRCIERGTLKLTVNKVDLSSGRLGEGYEYD